MEMKSEPWKVEILDMSKYIWNEKFTVWALE